MPRCHVCGTDEIMAYRCTYCGHTHCAVHRLPESHLCPEIELAAEARLTRGRLGDEGVRTVKVKVGAAGPLSGSWGRAEGKVAIGLLISTLVVFIAELLVGFPTAASPNPAFDATFVLDDTWPSKPWTLLTSVFSHASPSHIFFNGVALFFFGPLLERRIGSRRFTLLFIGGGVLAGLAQVHVFQVLFNEEGTAVLGASGAVMAVAGALAVLAPGLRVLFMFIVPMPLWGLIVFYAFFDVALLRVGDGVAHVAHLTGLLLGLLLGYAWRKQGFQFPGEIGYGRRPPWAR